MKEMKSIERRYIENRSGGHCPQCECVDLRGGRKDDQGEVIYQEIECLSCGIAWTDKYELTGVDATDFDPNEMVEADVVVGAKGSPLRVETYDLSNLEALLARALSDAEYDNASEEVALARKLLTKIDSQKVEVS